MLKYKQFFPNVGVLSVPVDENGEKLANFLVETAGRTAIRCVCEGETIRLDTCIGNKLQSLICSANYYIRSLTEKIYRRKRK